jgi:hypothetical protein
VRIHPYVEAAIARQLAAYSAASGIPSSAVVQDALRQHLDRTGDTALLLRRLDRLGREGARAHRDLEFLSEALAVFVRLRFAHTPGVADPAKDSARKAAESRFAQFLEHVVHRFTGRHRFLDDRSREILADDAELTRLPADDPRPAGATDLEEGDGE